MANISAFLLLLILFLCPSVPAQDWQKSLEKICKRNHFDFYPDFSDRSPLGYRVELDNKGRFVTASRPHAGVSNYSEVHSGHKPDMDEVFSRSDKLTASGLLKKFNLKDFTLKRKHKAVFTFHNLETTSMLVIPKSNREEFDTYAVIDEVLKVGDLDLRICSDDPNDMKKNPSQQASEGSKSTDSASVCGTSINVTADYSVIGGSFEQTKTDQYIVAGKDQYIGIRATFYDLGAASSTPGTLTKSKGMDFGGVWIVYNGVEKTAETSLYKFRINVRPAEHPLIKSPTPIRGLALADNADTPIRDCGEHCFDIDLQGLQSSRPFRIQNLWGELTIHEENVDSTVGVVLTTMSLQTRKPKIKKRKLVLL